MSQFRAVAQIDADPSGLVKAVGYAQKALGSLGKGLNQFGEEGGRFLFGQAERIGRMVAERAAELQHLAVTYSPEASAAANRTEAAKVMADQAVGLAVGPYAAAVERNKQQRIMEDAAGTIGMKDQVGSGMLMVDAAQGAMGTALTAVKDSALATLADPMNAPGPITLAAERTGLSGMLESAMQPIADWWVGDAPQSAATPEQREMLQIMRQLQQFTDRMAGVSR